jgi:glutathione S-transferase
MYKLHIANKNYSSWSLRPWVLLTTLDVAFEEHLHYFAQGYGQNHDFASFSPTALVPCLIDGDVTIWDSLAIAEYLAERHKGVWPEDNKARAYARSASAEMHSGFSALRQTCSMTCGQRVRLFDEPSGLKRDIARLQALWHQGLSSFGGPYLAGPAFSNVDAFFTPVAFRVQTYGLKLDTDSMAYVMRLLALPAMQNWYGQALSETLREQEHEDEIAAAGEIIADYRVKA